MFAFVCATIISTTGFRFSDVLSVVGGTRSIVTHPKNILNSANDFSLVYVFVCVERHFG